MFRTSQGQAVRNTARCIQTGPNCIKNSPRGGIRNEWVPITHGLIGHEPFTALEQWKVPRHRSL